MNKVYCYSKCTTCKKALKWLDDNHIDYELVDIKENNPDEKTLRILHKMSGLPLRKFFNFNESELYINKIGEVIMLVPKNDPWTEVFKGLNMFTDDFMEDGRGNLHYESRVSL